MGGQMGVCKHGTGLGDGAQRGSTGGGLVGVGLQIGANVGLQKGAGVRFKVGTRGFKIETGVGLKVGTGTGL